MSSEKRLFLFLVLTFASILGIQYLMDVTGLNPPPPKKPQAVAQAKKAERTGRRGREGRKKRRREGRGGRHRQGGKSSRRPRRSPKPKPRWPWSTPSELVLGSVRPDARRLSARGPLEQKGAGVASVASSRYEAEFVEGKKQRHRPLESSVRPKVPRRWRYPPPARHPADAALEERREEQADVRGQTRWRGRRSPKAGITDRAESRST